MTTIIADRKAKAIIADTMANGSEHPLKLKTKISRVRLNLSKRYPDKGFPEGEKEYLFAGCGSVVDVEKILEWLKGNDPISSRWDQAQYSDALLVGHSGIYLCDITGMILELDQDLHSIGSGSEFAIGAMSFGANAKQAMDVAVKNDAATGFEIQSMTIG